MNQRGFSTIVTLFMMPLFLSILLGFAWIYWFINENRILDNICFEGVMKSQENLVKINEQILALNSRAQSLYNEKIFLNLLIRTAGPNVKAAAIARKSWVVASQYQLKAVQEGLFLRSRIESQVPLYNMKRKLRARYRHMIDHWNSPHSRQGQIFISSKSSQLKVKYRDIASVYKRNHHHSTTQGLKAKWTIPIQSVVPTWLKRQVLISSQWSGQCHSHPHKGGLKWRAAIGKGNH